MEARGCETLWREGREGPCTYPARASLPAVLTGSRNQLKGNRKGEKESKQSEKSLELEMQGLFGLAEPPPGLGHSQQL